MSIRSTSLALLAFLCLSFTLSAQTRAEYYPNGNKKFEGEYFMAWSSDERKLELDIQRLDKGRQFNMGSSTRFDAPCSFLPVKIYNGKCSFYFDDGKKSHEGTYKAGVRHGMFTYWKRDGSKLAERSYVNGMADGKWTSYLPDGRAVVIANYRPFSEALLDSLRNAFETVEGFEDMEHSSNLLNLEGRMKISATGEYANVLRPYERDIERTLVVFNVRTGWHGEFQVFHPENGKKKLDAFFKDNRKHGNWKLFDDEGKLALEMKFDKDELVYAKDHKPSLMQSQSVVGTILDQPVSSEIFKYVEQMPEAPYDVHKYLNDNLKYPKGPEADAGARVVVQFVVTEDGTITDPKIVDHSPAVFHKEALRLVQSMPKWRPGKQNGRPVKVYFTLPILFRK